MNKNIFFALTLGGSLLISACTGTNTPITLIEEIRATAAAMEEKLVELDSEFLKMEAGNTSSSSPTSYTPDLASSSQALGITGTVWQDKGLSHYPYFSGHVKAMTGLIADTSQENFSSVTAIFMTKQSSIMEILQTIMKQAVEENNEAKKKFINSLKQLNTLGKDLSTQLNNLTALSVVAGFEAEGEVEKGGLYPIPMLSHEANGAGVTAGLFPGPAHLTIDCDDGNVPAGTVLRAWDLAEGKILGEWKPPVQEPGLVGAPLSISGSFNLPKGKLVDFTLFNNTGSNDPVSALSHSCSLTVVQMEPAEVPNMIKFTPGQQQALSLAYSQYLDELAQIEFQLGEQYAIAINDNTDDVHLIEATALRLGFEKSHLASIGNVIESGVISKEEMAFLQKQSDLSDLADFHLDKIKLQMQRQNQVMELMSNLLKSLHDTQKAVIGNMK